jgi:hypothetical protein
MRRHALLNIPRPRQNSYLRSRAQRVTYHAAYGRASVSRLRTGLYSKLNKRRYVCSCVTGRQFRSWLE